MIKIQVHNTLSRKKEEFTPIKPGEITMYVCGVTVYDFCHVGHGRAYVVFDTIRRFLEYTGYKVTYIQNFTDIDDKIINRANDMKKPWEELTQEYIAAYFKDIDALNVKRASLYPKATEHIVDMLRIISALIDKDMAYEVDGDVYFLVRKFEGYGKLSGRNLQDMIPGARVEVDQRKKHPLDFALWKTAKPGEPSWDSPWGQGRPGWHIECSAMSSRYLGQTFDIHGGGADLIFPHHENEIAQSESCWGKPFAHYWLHNGFVNINEQKMSKSLGNFFTLRDVYKKFKPEAIRLFYLTTHYRKPINYSDEQLEEATKGLDRLYSALYLENTKPGKNEKLQALETEFMESLADDFNTAKALAVLFDLARTINSGKSQQAQELLKKLGAVLGLFYGPKPSHTMGNDSTTNLLLQRKEARAKKDWAAADTIKKQLADMGYSVKDMPNGTSELVKI